MKKPKTKTKVVSCRLPTSVMKELEKAAKKSGRSVFEEFVWRIKQSLNLEYGAHI